MRKVTLAAFVIFGIGLLALIPAITMGQPGGGKGGGGKGAGGGGFGGGGKGGGGFTADPDKLFDFYARGRDFFLVSESRSLSLPLTQYAQEQGITNGQITRAQFKAFMDQKSKNDGAAPAQTFKGPFGGNPGGGGPIVINPGGNGPGGFGPGGNPGGFGPGGFGGGPGKKGGPRGQDAANMDPDTINKFADEEFKRHDRNGDGKLNEEEMPASLKANLSRWDRDGNKLIDINEYREFYLARLQGSEDASVQGRRGIDAIIIDEADLDRKPVVFRVGGKMPPGLPDWFQKLDTDKDGQVALYEWRMASKPLEEFKNWDLNDDGFITAEEASKHQASLKDAAKTSLAESGYDAGVVPSMGGDRKKGGFGGFGQGGGFPGGGGKGKGKGKNGGG